MSMTYNYHIPVLLNESVESLNIRPSFNYADCTLGAAGHSEKIAEAMSDGTFLHCFDRDIEAINVAKPKLAKFGSKIIYHHKPFSELNLVVASNTLGGILYDLGVSSHQIDSARGFSFAGDEVLDMRMNKNDDESAQDYLKNVSEEELTKVLKENSDLQMANRLAKRILLEILPVIKNKEKITAKHLNAAIEDVYKNRREDLNSLKARVYQAIRMEVNSEIKEIKESIEAAVNCLKSSGRLCVITYHSKEARAIKDVLAHFEKDCLCDKNLPICICGGNNKKIKKISKKPITSTAEELRRNSRSRSATLRVYEKI